MSFGQVPDHPGHPSEPSTPRRTPERRMTQRELVILSLLKCPEESQTHELR
jgi:hypothetical protein